jgi:hypothetical protein
MAIDCPVFLCGLQRKSPRRDVVRILQREQETRPAVIRLVLVIQRLPLYRRKSAEDVPLCVQNHGQCICVALAASVEFGSPETVAAPPLQQFEMFPAELCEDR